MPADAEEHADAVAPADPLAEREPPQVARDRRELLPQRRLGDRERAVRLRHEELREERGDPDAERGEPGGGRRRPGVERVRERHDDRPPTANAKKMVGAGTLSVARSARIEVTAAPPNIAETIPSTSPTPSRNVSAPRRGRGTRRRSRCARAIARWTVGRSLEQHEERSTAQIGKVLLRSVASPAGIRSMARK